MKNMRVVVHCMVANEERFIWYALNSVLPFVDKIMVWDTGSSDHTLEIVGKIKSEKIELKRLSAVDAESHTRTRDLMLKATDRSKYDWLLILDGDEVWPSTIFQRMLEETRLKSPDAVVVRTVNFVGDIYHKEPESAGHYRFGEKVGHYNLRLINLKLPNLHVSGPHGQQGYYSGKNLLQLIPTDRLLILDNIYYFHATHLDRSPFDQKTTKRSFKKKFELGERVDSATLPEIFFNHPNEIGNVTQRYGIEYWLIALVQTLPRRLKRIFLTSREGY